MKTKILFFTLILLCATSKAAIKSYSKVEQELSQWMSNVKKDSQASKNDKYKELDFSKCDYVVKCNFCGRFPSPKTWMSICNANGQEILCGLAQYDEDRHELSLTGIWNKLTNDSIVHLYGSFSISNYGNHEMTFKTKKGGALQVKPISICYFEGFYKDKSTKTIVKVAEPSFIAIERTAETPSHKFRYLYAPISSSIFETIPYDDIPSLLLNADYDVFLIRNDFTFEGKIVDRKINDHETVSYNFGEGKMILNNSPYKYNEMQVDGDYVRYTYGEYSTGNTIKQDLYIPIEKDKTITEYWDEIYCWEHYDHIHFEYKDGATFSGSAKTVITETENGKSITTNLKTGKYIYPNGDSFEGNLQGQHLGNIFFDGETTFADDKQICYGNYLEVYKLTNDQNLNIAAKANCPTTAREMAENYRKQNQKEEFRKSYIDYHCTSWGKPLYFNPAKEYAKELYGSYMTYDKKNDTYRWHDTNNCNEVSDDSNIQCIFAINPNGSRKFEIVYEDPSSPMASSNYVPKYINEYTWYSDGSIEKIKCFDYYTQQIILVCNFFTDGTLRSAYRYRIGNNGNVVLSKSKEAHPTWGGYECKQYDLNGNYERSTSWEIGESYGFFGNSMRMAPKSLDLSECFEEIDRFDCK